MSCLRAGEVAAYLDGELAPPAENLFEAHLTECSECSEKLNAQKRLLCALDFAFADEKSFQLPANFARSITVRAESDVSGLRSKDERQCALMIAAALFLAGIVAGIAGKQSGMTAFVIEKIFAQIWIIGAVLATFCYDFILGISVVLRMTGRIFLAESPFLTFLLTAVLVIAFIVLSRLLLKFHRIEHSGNKAEV